MNMYLLLSFCFLVFNQINFGMWKDRQDSSLLAFQKEALEDKKFEKNVYLHALAKDYEETGKNEPNEYVARWYEKYRLPKEIAYKRIQDASFNFSKHSLKGQQAVIKYSNPELQTLLHLLQLPQDMQHFIIQDLFSGHNKAIKKFFEAPLLQVYENLALAKEYAEKCDKKLNFEDWFLLDTPEQYKMTLKLLSQSGSTTSHITPQELAIIRSLPTCIKTHPALNKTYTRDYEWHENGQHVLKPLQSPSKQKFIGLLTAGFSMYSFFQSVIVNVLNNENLDLTRAMMLSSLGCSAGLTYGLSIFTYCPLEDIYGKSLSWIIPISTAPGILSFSKLDTLLTLTSMGISIGTFVGSSVEYLGNYQPQSLKMTKTLDQI